MMIIINTYIGDARFQGESKNISKRGKILVSHKEKH